jgi:hypothetical protein
MRQQRREFKKLEQRFAVLAKNEQWLADHYQNTMHSLEQDQSKGATLAEEEEHVLRCLGAALIMQWNTLPTKRSSARRQLTFPFNVVIDRHLTFQMPSFNHAS